MPGPLYVMPPLLWLLMIPLKMTFWPAETCRTFCERSIWLTLMGWVIVPVCVTSRLPP